MAEAETARASKLRARVRVDAILAVRDEEPTKTNEGTKSRKEGQTET